MLRVRPQDKKRYVLADKKDFEILEKIYKLESKSLSPEDEKLVKLARTQLERNWRTPLLEFLEKLFKKYK